MWKLSCFQVSASYSRHWDSEKFLLAEIHGPGLSCYTFTSLAGASVSLVCHLTGVAKPLKNKLRVAMHILWTWLPASSKKGANWPCSLGVEPENTPFMESWSLEDCNSLTWLRHRIPNEDRDRHHATQLPSPHSADECSHSLASPHGQVNTHQCRRLTRLLI